MDGFNSEIEMVEDGSPYILEYVSPAFGFHISVGKEDSLQEGTIQMSIVRLIVQYSTAGVNVAPQYWWTTIQAHWRLDTELTLLRNVLVDNK